MQLKVTFIGNTTKCKQPGFALVCRCTIHCAVLFMCVFVLVLLMLPKDGRRVQRRVD